LAILGQLLYAKQILQLTSLYSEYVKNQNLVKWMPRLEQTATNFSSVDIQVFQVQHWDATDEKYFFCIFFVSILIMIGRFSKT
jgi:hypothetical protein